MTQHLLDIIIHVYVHASYVYMQHMHIKHTVARQKILEKF